VFDLVAERGVPEADMWSTFNMGIGFCLVVDPEHVDDVLKSLFKHDPRIIGEVGPGERVTLG
jgi:phosphoribosylformylglycinamidine cyclo-ligase